MNIIGSACQRNLICPSPSGVPWLHLTDPQRTLGFLLKFHTQLDRFPEDVRVFWLVSTGFRLYRVPQNSRIVPDMVSFGFWTYLKRQPKNRSLGSVRSVQYDQYDLSGFRLCVIDTRALGLQYRLYDILMRKLMYGVPPATLVLPPSSSNMVLPWLLFINSNTV